MTEQEYIAAMEKAEEEAHLFMSKANANYTAFLRSARRGEVAGTVIEKSKEDVYRLSVGLFSVSEAEISRSGGKWRTLEGGKTLITLSIPQPVCEAIVNLLEQQEQQEQQNINP